MLNGYLPNAITYISSILNRSIYYEIVIYIIPPKIVLVISCELLLI